MNKPFAPFLLCAFAACFSSELPTPLRCSAEKPGCPEGLVCLEGTCQSYFADLGQTVDFAFDLLPSSQCADRKGRAIGKAWGCLGTFDYGKAQTLCASSAVVCTQATGLITDAECIFSGTAFFISSAYGKTQVTGDPSECNAETLPSPNTPGVFGCGAGFVNVKTACEGFRPFERISFATKILATTSPSTIDKIANQNPNYGVLCCPK